MAAGQQKKRLNAASLTRFNLLEQPLSKKKKLQSSDSAWSLRPHVSLKWDEDMKKAVARKEQIGITWVELSPFVSPLSTSTSSLADAYSVPEDIFQLKDIKEVLSYEVWKMYLSESERNFLVQFLPRGNDIDEVVQQLLMGENLHFGNPFKIWCASLVSGKLHPDAVLRRSQCIRASKKHYYGGIQIYHNGMIERLLNWKERWESCEDPENEIVEQIWRKGAGHSNHAISAMLPKLVGTSVIKEQACVGCRDHGKASKCMSYIKISRRQHQLIKSIEGSGDGIMLKSLTQILGEVKSLKLLPCEEFEEEERKRLHEHWLQMAYKDLPLAHKEFRKCIASNEHRRMIIKEEISKKMTRYVNEVDSTKLGEKCERLVSRLVRGADYKDIKGSHAGISTTVTIKYPVAIENHEELTCAADNKGSERNSESSAQQPVDYSDIEVSEGCCESSNSDENSETVLPHAEEHSSRQASQHTDDSAPQHQLNAEQSSDDLRSPPSWHEEHPQRIPSDSSHCGDSQVFNYMVGDNSESAKSTHLIQQKPLKTCSSPEDGANGSGAFASDTQDLRRVPPLNGYTDPNPITPYREIMGVLSSSVKTLAHSPLYGNLEPSANTGKLQDSFLSAKNSWEELGIKDSFSEAKEGSIYPFINNSTLSVSCREDEQHSTLAVNMESKMLAEEASRVEASATLFQPYGSQYPNIRMPPFSKGQNIITPSFPKEQGLLPSHGFQQLGNLKASGLPAFLQTNGPSRPFVFHPFQEQKGLLDQKQTGGEDLYIQQMAQKADFSSTSHAHNIPVESHDWLGFAAGSGGFPGDNLLSSELRPRNGWHMLEPHVSTAPCLNEGTNPDGSLYSILPTYSEISSGLSGNRFNSSRVMFPGNFVSEAVPDVGALSNSGYGSYAPTQLSSARSEDFAGLAALPKIGNVQWVNLPSQNLNLARFSSKSNTRSWNQ